MRPKYFALIISEAYKMARREVVEQSADFISSGHNFAQDLALCAVQMHGQVKSASLNPGSYTPSLAAGLPHFAAGWARCWGRDVFISLRGLFLATGNFAGAKEHILAFASVLKHGLIPNLLDSLRMPRWEFKCVYCKRLLTNDADIILVIRLGGCSKTFRTMCRCVRMGYQYFLRM